MRTLVVAICVALAAAWIGSGRELAAVARSVSQRHQFRDEPARSVVDDREHCVEAGAADVVGIDADHLGRSHFPERGRERQPVSLGGRSHQG